MALFYRKIRVSSWSTGSSHTPYHPRGDQEYQLQESFHHWKRGRTLFKIFDRKGAMSKNSYWKGILQQFLPTTIKRSTEKSVIFQEKGSIPQVINGNKTDFKDYGKNLPPMIGILERHEVLTEWIRDFLNDNFGELPNSVTIIDTRSISQLLTIAVVSRVLHLGQISRVEWNTVTLLG